MNIMYAANITQIVTQSNKSRKSMAKKKNMEKKVERERNIINNFENKWKIRIQHLQI